MIISAFPITSYAKVDTSDVGLFREDVEDVDVNHPFKYGHEIHYTTVNGKSYPLFCINKGKKSPNTAVGTKKGKDFVPTKAQEEAAKWIYAGYYLEHGDSVDELDMACCQKKVWSVLGQGYDHLGEGFTFTRDTYNKWVKKAKKNMDNLIKKPYFNKKNHIELKPGETKTFTDKHKVFEDYPTFTKSKNGITFKHKKGSNELTVTASASANNSKYFLRGYDEKLFKTTTNHNDQIMFYQPTNNSGSQNLIYSAYFDPVAFDVSASTSSAPTTVTGTKVDAEKTDAQGDATLTALTKQKLFSYGAYTVHQKKELSDIKSDSSFLRPLFIAI